MQSSSESDVSFDVVIVGFGPVGALSALILADAGLRILILEKSTEPHDQPRAVALDGETLRAFQRLGVADEVFGYCQPPREPNLIAFANSKREVLFGIDVPTFGPNGWSDILFFDQPELEIALREMVARSDLIEVRLGEEAVGLDQDSGGVTLQSRAVCGSNTTATRSRFLIGCDGASSFVRAALEIGWESLDYDQDWLVLDVTQGPNANLPVQTMQVCDPTRLTSYICVKDPNRRWEFQLLEGETPDEMLAPAKIGELLDPWTGPENYELRRAAVYQFHAATADVWRTERIFLAGDSAHQTPPFLGQGLNAGFRDAVNLGWKLPLVRSGTCGDDLLDSYAVERDPHARELVERAVGIGKLMENIAAGQAGLPEPHAPDSIHVHPGAPLIPPIRTGILASDQTSETHRVGELLRQPIVRDRANQKALFDESLGRGFAIVGREKADLVISPAAANVMRQLNGRIIALEDFELEKGHWDPLFEANCAAVIRPDRVIFGVARKSSALDGLVFELAAKLKLDPENRDR